MSIDIDRAAAVAEFETRKECKNSIQFTEAPESGQALVMGSAYVQKHVLNALGNPSRVRITIEPA